MQHGKLLLVTQEQLPGKYPIKETNQEDLRKVDIWQLDRTLFCLVNPGLDCSI